MLPFKWLTPGALLFVVTWILGSLAFGWYVSNFGSYNATYGALGGVVVLMIWFYLTAVMLLVGAELNALLAQKVEPEAIEAPAPQPEAWSPASGEYAPAADRGAPAGEPAPSSLPRKAVGLVVAGAALWRATGHSPASRSTDEAAHADRVTDKDNEDAAGRPRKAA
jgi:hypothetical protein